MIPGEFKVKLLEQNESDATSNKYSVKVTVTWPKLLIINIITALIVLIIIRQYQHSSNRESKVAITLEVMFTAFILHLFSVTIRDPSLALIPTISFSDHDVTNSIYSGILAGTIGLEVIRKFIAKLAPETHNRRATDRR